MTLKRRKLIAGNWKMNLNSVEATELADAIRVSLTQNPVDADVLLCPAFVHLEAVCGVMDELWEAQHEATDDDAPVFDARIFVGAQDCSPQNNGAFTGDVSAEMLSDIGCVAVVLGHSERRQYHAESDESVAAKVKAAWGQELLPIICVGETLEEREAGQTMDVIARQLAGSIPDGADQDNIVIAYEPVWAIGTGKVATLEQISEVHAFIRANLENRLAMVDELRIIYGGSVKADNAADIFALDDVDGALVGGASLKADSFLAIVRAAGL